MIVCSFHTGGKYEKLARRLRASLDRLGIKHFIERLKDRGSWQKNTHQKPQFILEAMRALKDDILWIDADAVVRLPMTIFENPMFDVAVHRFRPSTFTSSMEWHNNGILLNGTAYFRRGHFSETVLLRWKDENKLHPDRLDQKNLASVLSKVDPGHLRVLPAEYCWVERFMRKLGRGCCPVIVHEASAMGGALVKEEKGTGLEKPLQTQAPAERASEDHCYELSWAGHLYTLGGYAKANREILFRVGCTYKVSSFQDGIGHGEVEVDDWTRRRVEAFTSNKVSSAAPLLRFYIPVVESPGRHRIIFTMMETQRVHPDMVRTINQNYNELWTPTRWNAEAFRKSGVRIPMSVVPLGVDRHVYRPGLKGVMPKATLLTTKNAGRLEKPQGFLFIYVCQPTFRKGISFLVKAFADAFADQKDAALVIAGTANEDQLGSCDPFSLVGLPESVRARIYSLGGCYTERQMAELFSACGAYVTTSLGEGWNLPMTEAAACGLPVIAPAHTAHLDLLSEENAFLFHPDGYRKYREGDAVCKWYVGQEFAHYGDRSLEQLIGQLRSVHRYDATRSLKATQLSSEIRATYTWDHSAEVVLDRLEKLS